MGKIDPTLSRLLFQFRASLKRSEPENVIRARALELIEYGLDHEASEGDFCILVGKIVFKLVAGYTHETPDPRAQTLRDVCESAETRGFPILLWLKLVKENLKQPWFIEQEIKYVLRTKQAVLPGIRKIVRENMGIFSLNPPAKLFVNGYSRTAVTALAEIREQLGSPMDVVAPDAKNRRGISEGGILADALKGLDITTRVLGDEVAYEFLTTSDVDLFLTGVKVVSLGDHGRLEFINSPRQYSFIEGVKARRKSAKVVVFGGTYKIWPRDLYQEVKGTILEAQELGQMVDFIGNGDLVDIWVTENGTFTEEEFIQKYSRKLLPIHERFRAWLPPTTRFKDVENPRKIGGTMPAESAVLAALGTAGMDRADFSEAEFVELVDVYRSQIYVEDRWNTFKEKYEGRWVVFVNKACVVDTDTLEEALRLGREETKRKHFYVKHMVGESSFDAIASPEGAP